MRSLRRYLRVLWCGTFRGSLIVARRLDGIFSFFMCFGRWEYGYSRFSLRAGLVFKGGDFFGSCLSTTFFFNKVVFFFLYRFLI